MLSQDVVTRIINVNWGKLIALEFFISSTWQDPDPNNPHDLDTIDDAYGEQDNEFGIDGFPIGPAGVRFIGQPFPLDVFRGTAWKKQVRWDVILGSIQQGRFNKDASINGIQGVYEWEATGGDEVITGGLSFENQHVPRGNNGEPDPSQNFEVWHPPGFPRTTEFGEWEVLAGADWAVKFPEFSGGNFLDSQGRPINTPSFGFGGGINTRPEDGVFKSGTSHSGIVKGVEYTGPFQGTEGWTFSNIFPFQTPPFGYEFTEQDFKDVLGETAGAEAWANFRGEISYEGPAGFTPVLDNGDDIDTFAVDVSGIRLKRNATSTVELVPVAVGGNKDFLSVLMGLPSS